MGHFYRYCLESSLILVRSEVYLLYLIFELKCIEVVVYEGMVREKPSSKEEARQFIKGLPDFLCPISFCLIIFQK